MVLNPYSPEYALLTRIRDEAHRFAITYHRQRRNKSIKSSELDAIVGIGPKRKARLLREFGSLPRVKKASLDELTRVLGAALAEKTYSQLHPETGENQ